MAEPNYNEQKTSSSA